MEGSLGKAGADLLSSAEATTAYSSSESSSAADQLTSLDGGMLESFGQSGISRQSDGARSSGMQEGKAQICFDFTKVGHTRIFLGRNLRGSQGSLTGCEITFQLLSLPSVRSQPQAPCAGCLQSRRQVQVLARLGNHRALQQQREGHLLRLPPQPVPPWPALPLQPRPLQHRTAVPGKAKHPYTTKQPMRPTACLWQAEGVALMCCDGTWWWYQPRYPIPDTPIPYPHTPTAIVVAGLHQRREGEQGR